MNFKIQSQSDKVKLISEIEKLDESKKYDVSIKVQRQIRSLPQNRLYWLKVSCICDETGSDKDQIHEELKKMFLPPKMVKSLYGFLMDVPMSTTELDTKQFTDFLEKIDVFASSELGIVLPNPGDLAWNEFYEYYRDKI